MPEPTSASSPESEGSTSPSSPSVSAASDKSRSSQPALPFSPDTGPTSPDGETSTGSPLLPTPSAVQYGTNQGGAAGRVGPVRPSLDHMMRHLPTPTGGDAKASGHRQDTRSPASHDGMTLSDWATSDWASSPGDTPASRSAQQGDGQATRIPGTSGLSSPVLLASFDRATHSWRTFQATLALELPRFSQTLPRSGMTRDGQLFELRTSAHPTNGSDGSVSLPTPTSRDFRHHEDLDREGTPSLPSQVHTLLPTPKTPTGGPENRSSKAARDSGGAALAGSIGDLTKQQSDDGSE